VEERLAIATEMLRLAEEAGDRERAHQGHAWRMFALLELGDIPAADVDFEALVRLTDELRQPAHLWYLAVLRAIRALLEGRFEEGERLTRHARALGHQAQQAMAAESFGAQMNALRSAQGRVHELEAGVKRYVEQYPELPWGRIVLSHL